MPATHPLVPAPTRTNVNGAAFVVLCLLALSIQACRPPAQAEVIAAEFVEKAESAIEKRSLTALLDLLAEDYHDEFNRNRRDMLALASGYLRHSKSVYLFIDLQRAAFLSDSRIDCTLFVALASTPIEKRSMLPDLNGEFYRVDMELAQTDSRWRVIQVTWRQAMLDDVMNGEGADPS